MWSARKMKIIFHLKRGTLMVRSSAKHLPVNTALRCRNNWQIIKCRIRPLILSECSHVFCTRLCHGVPITSVHQLAHEERVKQFSTVIRFCYICNSTVVRVTCDKNRVPCDVKILNSLSQGSPEWSNTICAAM